MILAISLLGILATIILCCCIVVRVRLVMYFTCTMLYIFVFVTFAMLVIVAALLPIISQSCSYVDNQLTTNLGIFLLYF
jgi:hypothetical protein